MKVQWQFKYSKLTVSEAKEKVLITQETPTSVASPDNEKQVTIVCRALSHLLQEVPGNALVTITGKGSEDEEKGALSANLTYEVEK